MHQLQPGTTDEVLAGVFINVGVPGDGCQPKILPASGAGAPDGDYCKVMVFLGEQLGESPFLGGSKCRLKEPVERRPTTDSMTGGSLLRLVRGGGGLGAGVADEAVARVPAAHILHPGLEPVPLIDRLVEGQRCQLHAGQEEAA